MLVSREFSKRRNRLTIGRLCDVRRFEHSLEDWQYKQKNAQYNGKSVSLARCNTNTHTQTTLNTLTPAL